MLQWRLRGYVTPEDFEGSDTQRIQKALDVSSELDIGRVVLNGKYTVEQTLRVHGMTDLVLENAELLVNNDGTTSFVPNENIFLAAGIALLFVLPFFIKKKQ